MSSHHIVKDQQEPALIVDQWESFYNLLLGDLLEWLPRICCLEPIIEKIITLGIKIDFIVVESSSGDFWRKKLSDQLPMEIILAARKDLLKVAVEKLIEKGHRDVNILTSEKSLRSIIQQVLRFSEMNVMVYSGNRRTIIYRSTVYQKWMIAGDTIRVWSLKNCCFTTKGFQLDLKKMVTSDHELQVKKDGLITIKSDNHPFFITENLEMEAAS